MSVVVSTVLVVVFVVVVVFMVVSVVVSMTRPDVQPRHENLQICRKQQKQQKHGIMKNNCRIQLLIQQLEFVTQKHLSIATNKKDVYLRR